MTSARMLLVMPNPCISPPPAPEATPLIRPIAPPISPRMAIILHPCSRLQPQQQVETLILGFSLFPFSSSEKMTSLLFPTSSPSQLQEHTFLILHCSSLNQKAVGTRSKYELLWFFSQIRTMLSYTNLLFQIFLTSQVVTLKELVEVRVQEDFPPSICRFCSRCASCS